MVLISTDASVGSGLYFLVAKHNSVQICSGEMSCADGVSEVGTVEVVVYICNRTGFVLPLVDPARRFGPVENLSMEESHLEYKE